MSMTFKHLPVASRAKKAGFLGIRKKCTSLEVYYTPKTIQIKIKDDKAKKRILSFLESRFPLEDIETGGEE